MKICFFEMASWEEEYLKTQLSGHQLFFITDPLDSGHLPNQTDFEAISIFVSSKIDATVLDHFPQLKFIAIRSTGFDNVDLNQTKAKNIVVSFVPGYGDNTVAEYAFGLILSLSRKIYQAYHRIKEDGSFSVEGLQGFDIMGKTLGVVGVGRIGQHSIKIGNGFGMKVIAYDVKTNPDLENQLNFKYASLEELLKNSDIITVHVPYLPTTHHLINQENLSQVKKGCILINTARGAVVETAALVRGLQSGILGGVGLDVLEEEGPLKDEVEFLLKGHPNEQNLKTILQTHALIDMPNVIITPHNAFNTKEALQRILNTTIENINGFTSGQPQNLVK